MFPRSWGSTGRTKPPWIHAGSTILLVVYVGSDLGTRCRGHVCSMDITLSLASISYKVRLWFGSEGRPISSIAELFLTIDSELDSRRGSIMAFINLNSTHAFESMYSCSAGNSFSMIPPPLHTGSKRKLLRDVLKMGGRCENELRFTMERKCFQI